MQNLALKKIYPNELTDFIKSEPYKNFSTKPISPERAISYSHNPRKVDDKAVVFLAFDNSELVGFRTVLQDAIYVHGNKIPCIWLSGSWVKETHRRKGIALWLLDEVHTEYDGKIVFTNFAPHSLQLYLRSEKFYRRDLRLGRRFFLHPKISEWFGQKNALVKVLLKPVDLLINLLYKPFWMTMPHIRLSFQELDKFDENFEIFLQPHLERSLCKRGKGEFEWAKQFPWVVREGEEMNYPFSRICADFYSEWWEVKNGGIPTAIFLINHRNGILKIPYLFVENKTTTTQIALFILKMAKEKKVKEIELYDKSVIASIKRIFPLLLRKRKSLPVYVSKTFSIPKDGDFYVGDGEMIFL